MCFLSHAGLVRQTGDFSCIACLSQPCVRGGMSWKGFWSGESRGDSATHRNHRLSWSLLAQTGGCGQSEQSDC